MSSKGMKITSKIQPQNLKINGAKIASITFKSKKQLNHKQVETHLQKLKSKFEKMGDNYNMMLCVDTEFGARSGKQFSSKQRLKITETGDKSGEWDTTDAFTLYVWKAGTEEGGFDDINNDCLFNCIAGVVSVYRLKKGYSKPEQLKQFLGLGRNDPISIKLIPKIEKLYSININVSGDHSFTSSNPYPNKSTVDIILSDGHYTINEDKVTTGTLGRGITKREFQLVMCDEQTDYVLCYDGVDESRMSWDYYLQCKRDSRQNNISYIKEYRKVDPETKRPISIQEAYHNLISQANHLKEITQGKYDLARSEYKVTELARKMLAKTLASFPEPDPITLKEQQWHYYSNKHAIIFGEACEIESAYKYDMRSCYPNFMSDKTFSFPIKEGDFMTLDILPEVLTYGIYRVHIETSATEYIDRWFRFNDYDLYTHYSIYTARKLGLTISLIQDDEANALLYPKSRANSHSYLKQIVMELYNIKNENPLVKQILSCLWGVMCSKYIIKRTTKKPINLTTEILTSITPCGEELLVGYMKQGNIYKYNYARIGTFLTSKVRHSMAELLLPFNDHIKRYHTDGFCSDMPIPLQIGTQLGEWKEEVSGRKCIIKNCNSIEWV